MNTVPVPRDFAGMMVLPTYISLVHGIFFTTDGKVRTKWGRGRKGLYGVDCSSQSPRFGLGQVGAQAGNYNTGLARAREGIGQAGLGGMWVSEFTSVHRRRRNRELPCTFTNG